MTLHGSSDPQARTVDRSAPGYDDPDQPTGVLTRRRPTGRELGQEVRENPRASAIALVLSVLGSVVGAVLTAHVGHGWSGVLIGAAVAPVIPQIFQPAPSRVRWMLIAVVILTAIGVSVGGILLTQVTLKHSGTQLLTGSTTGSGGASSPSPTSAAGAGVAIQQGSGTTVRHGSGGGPAISVATTLECGAGPTGGQTSCPALQVESTGGTELAITSLAVTDADFTADGCVGRLAPGQSCTIDVRFAPQANGDRRATLLIHQNLPGPATRVSLSGVGQAADTCVTGYVWREAFSGDDVCVTPDVRSQALADNAAAASRVDPNGASGPESCVQGYVWRVARPSDLVCVTGDVRSATAQENADATAHRAFG